MQDRVQAQACFNQALKVQRDMLGAQHPDTVKTQQALNDLA
jgi:hypothetical protein